MTPGRKRPAKKRSPAKKAAPKASRTAGSGKRVAKTASSKRRKKARGGLGAVRKAGKRTWQTLKSRTARVVEGVKETFGG
jgi:hypothetical protein